MKKQKFTTGGWHVHRSDTGTSVWTDEKGKGRICTIMDRNEKEHRANAKLIAAAPELLKALISANKVLGAIDGHMAEVFEKEGLDSMIAYLDTKEAIEKATT